MRGYLDAKVSDVKLGAGVYVLMNNGVCVYVGSVGSKARLASRLHCHKKAFDFDSAQFCRVKSGSALGEEESQMIAWMAPLRNVKRSSVRPKTKPTGLEDPETILIESLEKRKFVSAPIDDVMDAEIERICAEKRRPRSFIIREALMYYFATQKV